MCIFHFISSTYFQFIILMLFIAIEARLENGAVWLSSRWRLCGQNRKPRPLTVKHIHIR